MSEDLGEIAETPTMIGIRLEPEQYKVLQFLCIQEEMEMMDFFGSAFRRFVEKREDANEKGEEFIYRAPPKEAKKVSTTGGDERALAELRAWAEKDNKPYSAAYYTAAYEHLQELREETDLSL